MRSFACQKKIVLSLSTLCLVGCVRAAITRWDGEGLDGKWNTATNWVGDILPGTSDDVILDNNFLAGNYIVILPAGTTTVSINSLTVSPSGANIIKLHLPVKYTASPGLNVTGAGNALVLENNGWLENYSGSAGGPGIAISNVFRINNGGHYFHSTSSGNATIISQLSVAAGTELGIVEFDVPAASYILSLSGRNYGTLILSAAANAGVASYLGSGAGICNIRGDLIINTGVNFSLSMSADFVVARHYDQGAASTFNLQSSTNNNVVKVAGNFTTHGNITESNTGLPVLELNGSSLQLIDGSGSVFSNSIDLRLNNASGFSLNGPISISYFTTIQAGNIALNNFDWTTGNLATPGLPSLTANHFVTNAAGALTKLVSAASSMLFPVGPSATTYNPVTINPATQSNFSVRVEPGINPGIAFPSYGINRTWNIKASAVVPNIQLRFQYATADANAGMIPPRNMEFLMYSGSAWNIIAGNSNQPTLGANPSWTNATTSAFTINNSFTPFALGLSGGYILPLDCFMDTRAAKTAQGSFISWNAGNCSQVKSFEVERSNGNGPYYSLGKIAVGTGSNYSFLDRQPLPVKNYYRLKIEKLSGEIRYSAIMLVENNQADDFLLKPSIAEDKIELSVAGNNDQTISIRIINPAGRLQKQIKQTIRNGENRVEISVHDLRPGLYFLHLNDGFVSVVKKFIKR
jgi:hypothetical protein